ncbi:MAG: diacylglycerol/lipid kinase family protein [Thermoplasmatota archaeon]
MTSLVYNPKSAAGKGKDLAIKAQRALSEHGVVVDLVATRSKGDASARVAERAQAGDPIVYVIGGDGTLSEAADGALRSAKPVVLAFLPGGTGNSFLRDFGPPELSVSIDRITNRAPRAIDALLVTWPGGERYAINVVHTGFAAHVGALADRRLKRLGASAYSVAVVGGLIRLRSPLTRLVCDGRDIRSRLALVALCNSIHTGGAMKMAPDAALDDGLMDVVAVSRVGRIRLLRLFPRIFDGNHIKEKEVTIYRAASVTVDPGRESPVLIDGEVLGTTPVTVRVLPKALQILA